MSEYDRCVGGVWAQCHPNFSPRTPVGVAGAKKAGQICVAIAREIHRRPGWKIKVEVSTRRRRTWVHRGVLVVAACQSWRDINHDFSHWLHIMHNRGERPHSPAHLLIERTGVEIFLRRLKWGTETGGKYVAAEDGWRPTEPKPKPKVDVVKKRYAALVAAQHRHEAKIEKAEASLRRARAGVAKYARAVRDYERRHGDRVAE